ncbi:MAG: hypothetical protein V2A62_03900 [Candidatus Woesearchaeota archaeon]
MEELKRIQSENAPAYAVGQVEYWQNRAFGKAREGELWSNVKANINIAEDYAKETGLEMKVDWEQLKREHALGVKVNGQKNVDQWINRAFEKAREGELWLNVEANIHIAEDYAKEADISIERIAKIEEIKQMYARR